MKISILYGNSIKKGVIIGICLLVVLGIIRAVNNQTQSKPSQITIYPNEIEQQEAIIKKQIEDEVYHTLDTPSLDSALHILQW